MKLPTAILTLTAILLTGILTSAVFTEPPVINTVTVPSENQNELNLLPAGRALPISNLSGGTNIHLMEKNDHMTFRLELFNSDEDSAQWVDITYNGATVRVRVPAGDSKKVGPFTISGRELSGTIPGDLNLILQAQSESTIKVMGTATPFGTS